MIVDNLTTWGSGGVYGTALAHFRVIYCAWMTVAMLGQLRGHIRWVCVCGQDRNLPQLLGFLKLPRLGSAMFTLLGLVFCAALTIPVWDARDAILALWVAGFAATLYFPQVIGVPEVRRKPGTVPVILLLLGAAGLAGGAEPVAWACLMTIKVLVAQVYLSSGIVKLRQSGMSWADGATLRMALLRYHLRDDNRGTLWLARRAGVCRLSSVMVLGFELTFWLMIPFPQLAWVYLPLGVAFHLGTAWLMRIHYWIYLFPAYAAFLLAR